MHVISEERALAHWRTLCQLPPTAFDLLLPRFVREQPALVARLLPALPANEKFPEIDDPSPRTREFWSLATTGALVYEIMVREAGHPLPALGKEELDAAGKKTDVLIEQAIASGKGAQALYLCSQPNLLGGVLTAQFGDTKPDEQGIIKALKLRVVLECLHHACGETPAQSPHVWDAERILIALSGQGDPMRREALSGCDMFRAELTPELIGELKWWAAEPRAAMAEDGSFGSHGLFQLAKWREASAWPVFRQLFSLPGDSSYDLLGDTITEEGAVLLAMVGGAHPAELQAMFEDESVDMFCRNTCLDALNCLVAWN
ncbi:MAG TPA: DUF1186 domain-containing protein, partial [Verrucomicrobiae bacterium]